MFVINLSLNILISVLISFLYFKNFVAYFQSENYDLYFGLKRYFKTRKIKYLIINSISFIGLIAFSILYFLLRGLVFVLVNKVILLIISLFNLIVLKNKLKLKVTFRIKRMVFILFVLQVLFNVSLFVVGLQLNFNFDGILILILNCLCCLLNVLVSCVVEKVVAFNFIRKAQKKLKSIKNLKVIGIVGSYAKTSVKNLLEQVLSAKYKVLVTPKNFNTMLGICKTIIDYLDDTYDYFVVEMGADHKDDIKKILKKFDIDLGVLTGINLQHVEKFKTVKNLIKTKTYIIDYLIGKNKMCFICLNNMCVCDSNYITIDNYINNNDIMFIHTDTCFNNPYIKNEYKHIQNMCRFVIDDVNNNSASTNFAMVLKNKNVLFKTNLNGLHNLINLSCAISIAQLCGVEVDLVKSVILNLTPIKNRMEIKRLDGGGLLIDNSYNANVSSYISSLKFLNDQKSLHKIVVTPGLVELGKYQRIENFKLGKLIGEYGFDLIISNKTNLKPILEGYKSVCCKSVKVFDFYSHELHFYINSLGLDYSVLIENDLPNSYC